MCARCGRHPRALDTFICSRCIADPDARREIRALLESGEPIDVQRRRAVEDYRWAGGWGRLP
jgi:predicted amidophosphoribosyltransferase